MSDPDSKKVSIPAWQQQQRDQTTPNQTTSPSPNSDTTTSPRPDLMDQASKFLQDESIRDAPTDQKISFLESKGLRNEEIQSLLGVSRNAEASSDTPSDDGKTQTPSPNGSQSTTEQPSEAASPTDQKSLSPASAPAQSPPSSSPPAPAPRSRDVPPIITYPEFLFKEQKKPPLVTFQSILYTLYGAAGLAASVYGASEYLVKPMVANLTSARHSLSETTQANLEKLNEKLEQNVSTIPPHPRSASADKPEEVEDEETDSVTSDPTELFHRDVATQTSPEFSEPSLTEGKPATETALPDSKAAVFTHATRLETIHSHLREFTDSDGGSNDADDGMRMRLNEMRHYLDGLIYSSPAYNVAGYGAYSSVDSSRPTGVGSGEEDAITSFKSEIRGVKGALLSARNFPTSRGGRVGGVSSGR